MKLIKWLLIIGVIAGGMLLLKDIAGHEEKHISNINTQHTQQVEQYTIGITKDVREKINKDVKQGYKDLPMEPSDNR